MVKSKLIETKLRKKINVSEDNYGRLHLPQLNAFRILLSVTPVLHFQCFGYPYIIIITKMLDAGVLKTRGYQNHISLQGTNGTSQVLGRS